ncbi:hypothetical protein PUMCH_004789 [Australozyma saopauloensis]|uniref:Uncharacterized protein n=1 Tax=Australozyma saopauloensis TaxID=291208 RepID=A0AAX4HH91_9ASCO|nr:hypothetical protein PUMCH_004789 [[Candida] saopauloensis]
MSLSYLQSLLPLENLEPYTSESEDVFGNLSDADLGVLTARFQTFQDLLPPLKAKLQPVGDFLHEFNASVGQLSQSLAALQAQSQDLSLNVDYQRNIVERLNPILLDLMIPPSVAVSIASDPVDEKWIENIRFISEKQQLILKINRDSSFEQYKNTKALEDLTRGLAIIEDKAVERVRDHLIKQIRQLRLSVKTSSQVIQERLLRVKEAFSFLKMRQPQLANQLQLAYIYTMKWYYTARFSKYLYSLQKLKLKNIDLLFVLGGSNDHSDAKPGLFGFMDTGTVSPSGAASRISLSEYFLSVDKRMSIFSTSEDEQGRKCIPSQIAETTPFSYWLEFLFKQWSYALLDNIIVEYLFFVDFFYQGREKFDHVNSLDSSSSSTLPAIDWCPFMFDGIFKIGHSLANWLATSSNQSLGARLTATAAVKAQFSPSAPCDSYAILFMIRIIQNASFALHNEFHIPVMDEYHNSLILLLWPHFTKIIDLNCEAIKKNILGTQSHRTLAKSLAPINTTQQFALLLSGLLKLAFVQEMAEDKQEQIQGEPICMSIVRLRNDYESALTKTSQQVFGSSKAKASQREMFLFNNYFLVTTILRNEFESSPITFVQEQVEHFSMLCEAYKPK